ncbi:MAG: hypothetical protein QXO93_03830 [Acidilobaceae archaeon]
MSGKLIVISHYTGYFGSLVLLWLLMLIKIVDRVLNIPDLIFNILAILLALSSLAFGVLGLLFVIGFGVLIGRRG